MADKKTAGLETHKKNKSTVIGSMVILVIVILSFVAWPIISNSTGVGFSANFGSYKGQQIKYSNATKGLFYQEVTSETNGIDASNRLQVYNAWLRAFNNTINITGIKTFLADEQVHFTEEEIEKEVIERYFLDSNAKFNSQAYKRVNASDLENIKEQIEVNLYNNYWFDRYYNFSFIPSSLDKILAEAPGQNEKRKISYVNFKFSDFPAEEVLAFAQQNTKLFRTVKLRRIILNDAAAVLSVTEQLDAGELSFADIATESSVGPYKDSGGDMGVDLAYHELLDSLASPEDADTVFALQEGQISPALVNGANTYFYQMLETPVNLDLEENITTVRTYIENKELSIITDFLRGEAENLKSELAASKQSLEAVAAQNDLEYFETDFFALNYNSVPFYDEVNTAFTDPSISIAASAHKEFLKNVFALEPNELSDPLLLGANNLILFQLLAIQEQDDAALEPDGSEETRTAVLNGFFASSYLNAVALDFYEPKNLRNNFDNAFNQLFVSAN